MLITINISSPGQFTDLAYNFTEPQSRKLTEHVHTLFEELKFQDRELASDTSRMFEELKIQYNEMAASLRTASKKYKSLQHEIITIKNDITKENMAQYQELVLYIRDSYDKLKKQNIELAEYMRNVHDSAYCDKMNDKQDGLISALANNLAALTLPTFNSFKNYYKEEILFASEVISDISETVSEGVRNVADSIYNFTT